MAEEIRRGDECATGSTRDHISKHPQTHTHRRNREDQDETFQLPILSSGIYRCMSFWKIAENIREII